jgi:hypothetical protein
MINGVFECVEPSVWRNQNKILFKRLLRTLEPPDCLLVVARPVEVGRLDLTEPLWKSEAVC